MLPTQGQGASQSIEDAEALGAFFEDIEQSPSMEQLEGIFQVSSHKHTLSLNMVYWHDRKSSGLDMRGSVWSRAIAGRPQNQVLLRSRRLLPCSYFLDLISAYIFTNFTKRKPDEFMDYNCMYRGAKKWLQTVSPVWWQAIGLEEFQLSFCSVTWPIWLLYKSVNSNNSSRLQT